MDPSGLFRKRTNFKVTSSFEEDCLPQHALAFLKKLSFSVLLLQKISFLEEDKDMLRRTILLNGGRLATLLTLIWV